MFATHCLVAAILVMLPLPALAWGPEGHEIVAHIAARELGPRARAEVSALLGGDAEAMMVADADWADEIRDARPDSARWHFVDIELGSNGFVRSRDCPHDDCVVAQIEKDVRIAADRRQPRAARAEALKFLIHFAGDVHQPLHAADNHDAGGNDIKLRLGNRRTNMHHVWDTVLVESLGRDAAEIAMEIRTETPPRQRVAWRLGSAADWATESFLVARRSIYSPLLAQPSRQPAQLPRSYWDNALPLVRTQLAKAGVRLGWLLNTMFK